jgi:hypothetical protein
MRTELMNDERGSTVPLLWTGGWDSTFRLLQLCHDTRARIQPIYLQSEKRASTKREMRVMDTVRRGLLQRQPGLEERLLPVHYDDFDQVEIEPDIEQKWNEIEETHGHLGIQYPVLASYAREHDLDKLELSVEARSEEESTIMSLLNPIVEMRDSPAGPVPGIPDAARGPVTMMDRFTFPLIEYTKLEMKKEAEGRGWMPMMKKTWFCHQPVFGYPCGFCTPCRIVQEEHMGHRVGYLGQMLSPLVHPRKGTTRLLKQMRIKEEIMSLLSYLGLK